MTSYAATVDSHFHLSRAAAASAMQQHALLEVAEWQPGVAEYCVGHGRHERR
jgi:hypothetical protein